MTIYCIKFKTCVDTQSGSDAHSLKDTLLNILNVSANVDPNGHKLKKFTTLTSGHRCDGCNKQAIPKNEELWGCRVCDYDCRI